MAVKLKAIASLRPRLVMGRMITLEDLEPVIAAKTTFNEGIVYSILREFREQVIRYALDGRSVKLEGLGVFTPTIGLNGKISLSHRVDNKLESQLNIKGGYKGEIRNRDMIGKTVEDIIVRWDEENPGDPVIIT